MSPEVLSKLQACFNNDEKPTCGEKYQTKNEENLGTESCCNSCYICLQTSIDEDQESDDEQSGYTKMYSYHKEAGKNEQLNSAGDCETSKTLEHGIYNNFRNLIGEKITDDSDDDEIYIDVLPYYKGQDYNEVCSLTKERQVIKRRKNFALRYKYEECKAQGRPSLPELYQNISAPVARRCKSETSLINENMFFARRRAFCVTSVYNCKKVI